ncbi:MAG: YicC/YloC family endoribonuclease [Sphaerochaetaceae bacterium]
MKSMTGYGHKEIQSEDFSLSIDIKSYNNRFLEIFDNINDSLKEYETEINNRIKKICSRGHVEINVKVKTLKSNQEIKVDEVALKHYKEAFDLINKTLETKIAINYSDLSQIDGLISFVENRDSSLTKEVFFEVFDEALAQFDESRKKEGQNTEVDLNEKLLEFTKSLDLVKSMSTKLEDKLKKLLIERFDELLRDKGYDEGRFLQEVATLLMKYTINEELVRLDSHLTEFKRLFKETGSVGKKFDFICQEMNREINTIGSKSNMVGISQSVVVMKDCLENIREQSKNLE